MKILNNKRNSNEKGATGAEYAVMLALILTVTVEIFPAIGLGTKYPFRRAALCFGGGTDNIASVLPLTQQQVCETGIGRTLDGGTPPVSTTSSSSSSSGNNED